MNKIICTFIVSSSLFLISESIIFAESVTTNISCTSIFSSVPKQIVDSHAVNAYYDLEISNLSLQERIVQGNIRSMYRDLINYYLGKILEIEAPARKINLITAPNGNNPLIFLKDLPLVFSRLHVTFDNYTTHQFSIRNKGILQQYGDQYEYEYGKNEIVDEYEDRMGMEEYLLLFLQKQLKFYPNGNDNTMTLLERLQNQEDEVFLISKKYQKLLQIKDDDYSKKTKPVITYDLSTEDNKKYLRMLLHHILTYHIFANESFKSADSTLKTKMLEETFYTLVTGENTTSYQYKYVKFNHFFQDIINNLKYMVEHQKRSYNEVIFKNTDLSIERQEQLAKEVYPNVFVNKEEFLPRLGSTLLEQDMFFFIKYINASSEKEKILQFINQYSEKTSEESAIFDTFNLYVKKHPEINIFDLKQTFYIKGFPVYLDKLVKSLLKQKTINLSNKDIIDIILSLYDTNVSKLGITYDEAAKKFGLIARNDSDNNTSLYFTEKKIYAYQEALYNILLYLVDNDKDFCTDMILLNDDIIHAFRETLILDKIFSDSLY